MQEIESFNRALERSRQKKSHAKLRKPSQAKPNNDFKI
jgi:hypothetical protein